jgi:pimeloyl-ACP methyl ester carboxylesterase
MQKQAETQQQQPVTSVFTDRHFVDVGKARLCYRRAGEGPALVLLHGFPLSGLTWRKPIPLLSSRFTCYAFDLVGLGDSTSTTATDFASPGQGRAVKQALTELGVDSYALLGNDTGGWVARELALHDRKRVSHLALTNTEIPGHRPPWIPLYQVAVRLPGSSSVMHRMLLSRSLMRSPMGFAGCFENLDHIDGEFADLFVRPIASSQKRLRNMFRFLERMNFGRIDEFQQLHQQLTMPTTFLWGAADPTFPVKRARKMAAQFPNVREFRTLPGAKLFFYEEHPEIVADWLIEFLGA